MNFQFKIQQYQTDAVKSVVDVFEGQPFQDKMKYVRDIGITERPSAQFTMFGETALDTENITGFSNAPVRLTHADLLENINKVQRDNNILQSTDLVLDIGACSLDVEMETGTGKTYVYIKTMFELNKHYGWSKFIVVVPSVAIREGVKKSFEITQNHFMEQYGKKIDAFIYNSNNLQKIDDFSSNADITCMIINMQAFASSLKEGASNAAARIIYTERDNFGSRRPIDVIAANRPIIILDEPQKMGGTATQTSLKRFNPLFSINYSATHKNHHNPVYVLDAVDAFNKRLVKKIEVKGFDIKNLAGADSYVYLQKILIDPKKPPRAKLEFEVSHSSGPKRESHILNYGDDIFVASHNLEEYKNGYTISNIDPINDRVEFLNGLVLSTGSATGDVHEKDVRRIQIRETIRSHFEKERNLYDKGIKTLSLFFIDEVKNYRLYDEEGNQQLGEYGKIFEEEYTNVLNEYLSLYTDDPYQQYLRKYCLSASYAHAGYFSIDKKGRSVNSEIKRGADISEDISAYDLILKNKERLLSFEEPTRFIFSHSALREGWDNTNVFQICTLKQGGDSPTQKRQEVGRGLRLCVNQNGERIDAEKVGDNVFAYNKLTVIASEGYKDFVADLQTGIKEALYDRPKKADESYFRNKVVIVDGNRHVITDAEARMINFYLIQHGYTDYDGNITAGYHQDLEGDSLAALPEALKDITEGVHTLIQGIFDPSVLNDMIEDGNKTKVTENAVNDNFYKKEFQKLWEYINHQYAYTVEFNSEELIEKAVKSLNENMQVTTLKYVVTTGEQTETSFSLDGGSAFNVLRQNTQVLRNATSSQVEYDLIGKIAEGTTLTRKTVATILSKMEGYRFEMFKKNPEEFIRKAILFINEEKAKTVVEHISYNKTENVFDSGIFTADKADCEVARAYRAQKNVQDYVLTDGKPGESVEWRFAKELDAADEVCVYAKLPRGFHIPTPVGNYSPDWAIAFNEGSVKHIYFVAETKGSMQEMDLRPIEKAKIDCAKALFNNLSSSQVRYNVVTDYQKLLDIVKA